MSSSKLQRLLRLVQLLQSGRSYRASDLARACGVSRRTVFRDLELLRASGLEVLYDPLEGRYRLLGEVLLPSANFTLEEALALLTLCHELGDHQGVPLWGAAHRAALKLESVLPAHLRQQLAQLSPAIHIRLEARNPLNQKQHVLQQLLRAWSRRQAVRIHYDSLADGGPILTKLHPYCILFSRRSWYCIGRSSLHRATRTFNLGRIQHLELLEERYRIPAGFSLRRYLRNAWHLIPEPGPDQHVHLRFQPLVARNVAEVQWHPTQRTRFNPDGTLDFWVRVSGLWEISWWVMGYGDQVEVLAPEKLRQMICQRVQNLARLYRLAPTSPPMRPHLPTKTPATRSSSDPTAKGKK